MAPLGRLVIAVMLCLPGQAALAGSIFKCKTPSGAYHYQEKPCAKEAETVSSWASTTAAAGESTAESGVSADQPLIIGQGNGGHYYIDASVNDQYVNFVIDTGATTVALPLSTAAGAGLNCKKDAYMSTANGVTRGCVVVIDKLKLGHFTLHRVDAVVMPNLTSPLLGMNVLKQFRVEQDNGQMRLSKKY
jgi:clan AA aspartic protease (TIGR02281 family)